MHYSGKKNLIAYVKKNVLSKNFNLYYGNITHNKKLLVYKKLYILKDKKCAECKIPYVNQDVTGINNFTKNWKKQRNISLNIFKTNTTVKFQSIRSSRKNCAGFTFLPTENTDIYEKNVFEFTRKNYNEFNLFINNPISLVQSFGLCLIRFSGNS